MTLPLSQTVTSQAALMHYISSCFTSLLAYNLNLHHLWLGGVVVSVSDSWSRGRGFDSQPMHRQATTLGMLLTPMCLCLPSSIIWYLARAFMLMQCMWLPFVGPMNKGSIVVAVLKWCWSHRVCDTRVNYLLCFLLHLILSDAILVWYLVIMYCYVYCVTEGGSSWWCRLPSWSHCICHWIQYRRSVLLLLCCLSCHLVATYYDASYTYWWCSGWAPDSWSKGCWFNCRLGCYQIN